MTVTVPTGRFEWERLVRRITMPKPVKLVALVLATYADPDGSRVRPGMEVLAAVTGDSERNARRLLGTLTKMNLVTLVSRGGGRGGNGRASEYQLTIPTDLLDRFELLTPGDKPVSPDTQVSSQNGSQPVDEPVDNPDSPDTQMSAHSDEDTEIDRTWATHKNGLTGHGRHIDRTSRCPTTTHDHPQKRPIHVVTTELEYRPRARDQTVTKKSNGKGKTAA